MKRYIITDPCYIIPKDRWADVCRDTKAIADLLTEMTGATAKVATTGTQAGEWDNEMLFRSSYQSKVQPLNGCRFTSDTGLVSISLMTPEMEEMLGGVDTDAAAILQMPDTYEVHTDMRTDDERLTVVDVEFTDKTDGSYDILTSMNADEFFEQ